jgi:hypothetical protein
MKDEKFISIFQLKSIFILKNKLFAPMHLLLSTTNVVLLQTDNRSAETPERTQSDLFRHYTPCQSIQHGYKIEKGSGKGQRYIRVKH